MAGWLTKVRNDNSNIVDAIMFYEKQIEEGKKELSLRGSIEKHARDMPGIVEYRFYQLQEIEAILEFLNIELRKLRSKLFKKYLLFGLLMDLQLWPWIASPRSTIAYIPGGDVIENVQRFMVFHLATALAWDIPRAIFNAILILFLGRPILNSLSRAMRRGNVVIDRVHAREQMVV